MYHTLAAKVWLNWSVDVALPYILPQDMIKFGFSSREYVILHENSKDATAPADEGVEDGVEDDQ